MRCDKCGGMMLRGDGEVVCISCGKALAVRTVRVAAVKYTPAPTDPQIRFVRLPHGEITQEFE